MGALADMVRDDRGRFLKNLAAVRPELRVAETAKALILRNLDQGIGEDGQRFAPYAESTRKRKAARGQQVHPPNLSDSDEMRRSLTVRAGRRSAGQLGRTQAAEIVAEGGRNERLLRIHITGAPRRRLPRRQPGLTRRQKAMLRRDFRGYVDQALPADRRRRVKIVVFQ